MTTKDQDLETYGDNLSRQEMLDAINMKIARTGGGTGPGETGYFLPVMYKDVEKYFDKSDILERYKFFRIYTYWKIKGEPLDKQSDECIQYVYSLI